MSRSLASEVGEPVFRDFLLEQVMSHSSRRQFVAIGLGAVGGLALAGDEPVRQEPPALEAKANEDVFGHEQLCVTIWPAKTQVEPGEEFEVKLRVVNSSQELQSLQVWSC